MKSVLLHDTSVLLNLFATDCFEAIISSFPAKFAICRDVQKEAIALRDTSSGEMVPIDIMPLATSGLLEILDLNGEDEADLYLVHIRLMDPGEAMSLAIAVTRNYELAIDDKRARKITTDSFPTLPLWTTAEIIQHWAVHQNVSPAQLSSVLSKIEARACYSPSKSHPLYDWWNKARGMR